MTNSPSFENLYNLDLECKKKKKQYKIMEKQVITEILNILNITYIFLVRINFETNTIFIFERFEKFNPSKSQLQNLVNYLNCESITLENVSGVVIISWIDKK